MARTNVPWKLVLCVEASHRGRVAPVRVCVGILVAIATASGAAAEQPPALPPLELVDLDGRAWRLAGGGEGDTATAVVFLSTTCPIATASLPRLDELAQRPAAADAPRHADDARATTVRSFGVVSDPMLTRAAAVAHFAARRNRLPILFDASGELRAALQPTHVPEAFLFDGSGALVYRGAIDDAFATVGRRRTAVRHHYL